jgi:hypothetical protein
MTDPRPWRARAASVLDTGLALVAGGKYGCDAGILAGWAGMVGRPCGLAGPGPESHIGDMLATEFSRLLRPPPASAAFAVPAVAGVTGKKGVPGSMQFGRRGSRSCSRVCTELGGGPLRNWEPTAGSPGGATMPDWRNDSMLSSPMPCFRSRVRSFLFSSATFRAANWISVDASIPCSSQTRRRCSSSWRYSFRLARERLWLSRIRARLAFSYLFTQSIHTASNSAAGRPVGRG